MQLKGSQKFDHSAEDVWDALHNKDILIEVIPGCQSMELSENGEYDVVLKLGVAAVKGQYSGKVKLEDIEKPVIYKLIASGSGSPGHVEIQMECRITSLKEGCQLDWDCNAEIGGKIASVGNRVLSGIAKFMADKFFKDLQKQIKKSKIT